MENERFTAADEKALALNLAYAALVNTLAEQGVIRMKLLHANLFAASLKLEELGEPNAASYIATLHDQIEHFPIRPGSGRPPNPRPA